MPTGTTERRDFQIDDSRVALWLTTPSGAGPHPTVVLVHGLGANHSMMLEQYEREFSNVGYAVVAFDFRNIGESDGSPRQWIAMRRHEHDLHAVLDYVKELPEVDASQVALWGTSLGAMHVVRVASRRDDIAAAAIQCPIVYGPGAAATSALGPILRLSPVIISDAIRGLLGLERRYVQIVGADEGHAIVDAPGAYQGWLSTVPPGGSFENKITAASAIGLVVTTATRHARKLNAPLLVCVSDNEGLMDPKYAVRVAERAPRGERRHFAADHFQVYHQPAYQAVVGAQLEFFGRHLRVVR